MSLSSFRPRSSLQILSMGLSAVAEEPARQSVVVERGLVQERAKAPQVFILDPVAAAVHRDAWLDLQARALEPNAFLDPDFVFAAAQHLGQARRPRIALVWDAWPHDGRLIAVHLLERPRLRRRSILRPWIDELVPLGAPLLDRERGIAAAAALIDWTVASGAAGLMLRSLPTHGPAGAAIVEAARNRGCAVETIAAWERAVLWLGPTAGRSGTAALSAKGGKEARRQGRRLAEVGTLAYASARSDDDIRNALERFMALEARGWKGHAGTALLMQVGSTAFTRAMTRLLQHRGRCRVDSLTLDGVPIAMGIVLSDGGSDFLWKIAYDESLSRFSPGVQFVLDFTARQAREARAGVTDSCAAPDHPMIDRLWRDRLALADVVIGNGPGSDGAIRRMRTLRRLRDFAKRVRAAWRSRTSHPAHRRAPPLPR